MSAKRLDSGGHIDRSKRINFSWDGRSLSGFAGDSLASASLINANSSAKPTRQDQLKEMRRYVVSGAWSTLRGYFSFLLLPVGYGRQIALWGHYY